MLHLTIETQPETDRDPVRAAWEELCAADGEAIDVAIQTGGFLPRATCERVDMAAALWDAIALDDRAAMLSDLFGPPHGSW